MRRGRGSLWTSGLAALLVVFSLVLLPGSTTAQMTEIAPGTTVEVLTDYGDLGIPGVSRARLLRITVQPGSKFPPDFTVKTVNF